MSSKIVLDLKNFRHISSDKNMTTLEHKKDKHKISLHHSSLSPESQAQLKALAGIGKAAMTSQQAQESQDQAPKRMAEGGDTDSKQYRPGDRPDTVVAGQSQGTPPPVKKTSAEQTKDYSTSERTRGWWAEGGDVPRQQYAEGSPDKVKKDDSVHMSDYVDMAKNLPEELSNLSLPYSNPSPDKAPAQQEQPDNRDLMTKLGAVAGKYGIDRVHDAATALRAIGSGVQAVGNQANKFKEGVEQGSGVNLSQALAPVPDRAPAGQPAQPQDQAPGLMPEQQAPAQPQQPNPMDAAMGNAEEGIRAGYEQQQAGNNKQVEAAKIKADAEIAARNQDLEAKQRALGKFQNEYNFLDKQYKDTFADYQNGHVDPSHYWKDHSKLASGIGMILSGMGGGLSHNGSNLAFENLKYQMDNDMKAQEAELGKKKNLLDANYRQFGNMRDAAEMLRIQQLGYVQSNIEKAASMAKTPEAQANALKANGELEIKKQQALMDFSMRRAMINYSQGTNNPQDAENQFRHMVGIARMQNPELAKSMEERHVTGIGNANRPVTDNDRKQLVAHQEFDSIAKDLHDFVKQHRGEISTFHQVDKDTAMRLATLLQAKFREGTLKTVYREGEQPLLDKAVDTNPLAVYNYFRELPKLEGLMEQNNKMSNILKNSYDLPQTQLAPTRQPQSNQSNDAAMAWAKANPNDPRAAKILEITNKR